jgi:hemoglobin
VKSPRPSIYEFAGGDGAWLSFARALHQRCLDDPELNHPFSHSLDPQHLDHLASYLVEVFGGPPVYSQTCGGQSAMLRIHDEVVPQEWATRFCECFVAAADDAGLPDDAEFRQVLREYVAYASDEIQSFARHGSEGSPEPSVPRWSWDGLVAPSP